ncbi:MAG: glucan biosynthesis protein G [Paracoccaceae bacterium]|nr:MAG: glucan biosynthesis protein G [Paracoccaceae bacterium]
MTASPHPDTQVNLRRRTLLAGAASLLFAPSLARPALAEPVLPEGAAFDFDALSAMMRAAAQRPHVPPVLVAADGLAATYDAWRRIRWRRSQTRWWEGAGAGGFGLQAFAPGWLYREPVALFDVTDGTVRPLTMTAADFEDDAGPLAADGRALPGVAGFRLLYPLNAADRQDELVAFLGASYFRALGQGSAYGISARGLALDTATGSPEEFPRFTAFYLERPAPGARQVVFHASLESPRVAGAFRFAVSPGPATEVDVTARLYFRGAVEMLGIGCLTSMHLFDGKNRAAFDDHRPRVHDSEGLAIVTGHGEEIWRPLNNPVRLSQSLFAGTPRSFGLYQRDRDLASFRDLEALYHRRPSVEVTPLSDWGDGMVRLVEIPAPNETEDNIVAAFVPGDGRVGAGEARSYSWRLRWGDLPPEGRLARAVVMRSGAGGVSGVASPLGKRKFVVDFAGPGLPPPPADPQAPPVLSADLRVADAEIVTQVLEPLSAGAGWRLTIDLRATPGTVVEMSARLISDGTPVSETWAYQWVSAA